jgi:hypothetical protein
MSFPFQIKLKNPSVSTPKTISSQVWGKTRHLTYHKFLKNIRAANLLLQPLKYSYSCCLQGAKQMEIGSRPLAHLWSSHSPPPNCSQSLYSIASNTLKSPILPI